MTNLLLVGGRAHEFVVDKAGTGAGTGAVTLCGSIAPRPMFNIMKDSLLYQQYSLTDPVGNEILILHLSCCYQLSELSKKK
jgi:hypothetical protein